MDKIDNKETIIEKLKKLLALADKGIDGEAAAAKAQLDKLLAKYGITLEEITNEATQRYEFVIHNSREKRLFFAVYFHIVPSKTIEYYKSELGGGWCKFCGIALTRLQYIDISRLFVLYCDALEKERKALQRKTRLLTDAFIQANEIFSARQDEETSRRRNISQRELDKLRDIYRQSRDIQRTETRRALGSGLVLNGGGGHAV